MQSRILILVLFIFCYTEIVTSYTYIKVPDNGIINVVPGRNAIFKVKLDTMILINCTVYVPRGGEVILKPGIHIGQNISYWGEGYDDGECGVLIKNLTPENNGTWTLGTKTKNSLNFEIHNFILNVYDSIPKLNRSDTQYINEDQNGEVFIGSQYASFCQGKHPNGNWMPKIKGPCKYKIEKALLSDGGKWTATYTLTGLMSELQDEINLVINRSIEITGHLTPNALTKDYKNLYCKLVSLDEGKTTIVDYCYLENLNSTNKNKKIWIDEGMGTDDYIYYGIGFHNREYKECGLTFLRPFKSEEKGLWKCAFGSIYKEEISVNITVS